MLEGSGHPAGSVLAIDPGRDKCGVAVLAESGEVLHKGIVSTELVATEVIRLIEEHSVVRLLLGDRTAAGEVRRRLSREECPLEPLYVDEHRSTEQGRRRYFRENPPRGWRRLLPLGLQTPPCPYDDYVAVILAEQYLASQPRR